LHRHPDCKYAPPVASRLAVSKRGAAAILGEKTYFACVQNIPFSYNILIFNLFFSNN
jgi:hypothetical protein